MSIFSGLKIALISGAVMVSAVVANAADLVVGANIGYVPWEFQDESGKTVGFEIDLVTEVAARLNRPLKIENIPFNGLFAAVQSGRVNIAMAGITITQKRLESVSFAQPYYDSDQSLTVTTSSGIKKLDDLKGKVVAVDTGSTGDVWATANTEKYGFSDIRRFEGLSPAMLDLQAGRIDGYVADLPAAQYYIKDKPALVVAERIPTGEQYSLMFAKNDPLLKEVNEVITKLKGEGFIAKIHEKWFGTKPAETSSTVKVADIPVAK